MGEWITMRTQVLQWKIDEDNKFWDLIFSMMKQLLTQKQQTQVNDNQNVKHQEGTQGMDHRADHEWSMTKLHLIDDM